MSYLINIPAGINLEDALKQMLPSLWVGSREVLSSRVLCDFTSSGGVRALHTSGLTTLEEWQVSKGISHATARELIYVLQDLLHNDLAKMLMPIPLLALGDRFQHKNEECVLGITIAPRTLNLGFFGTNNFSPTARFLLSSPA